MKDNRNLGKYDLNKLLRNPALIHRIQDNLMALQGEGVFSQTLRDNARDKPRMCIKMIAEQYQTNEREIIEIVGKPTIELIQEYLGLTLADDLKTIRI